jgi:hypothetical protein
MVGCVGSLVKTAKLGVGSWVGKNGGGYKDEDEDTWMRISCGRAIGASTL